MADIFSDDISHDEHIRELRAGLKQRINSSLSDHDCLRFLRARAGSIEKATEMIMKWYEWRHTLLEPLPPDNLRFSPNTITSMPTTLDQHPFASLLPVAHHGFDRLGHPIYWEKTGLIQSQFTEVRKHFEVSELLQYSVLSREIFSLRYQFASERVSQPITQCVVVNDMKGLSVSLDFESIWYMKQVLAIDSSYYPERLFRLYLVNCPWYFPAIFSIFSPLIDQRTRNKFRVLGSNYQAELEELIDPSVIPTHFGGSCDSVQWDIKPSFESGGSKEQVEQALGKQLLDLARHCTEQEYHALKEALYLAKRVSFVKDFICHRLNVITEMSEDEVAELCQVSAVSIERGNAEETRDADADANVDHGPDGYSKENILRRLAVDLEQVERILCEEAMKLGDNYGEIDGGGDDGGGKSFTEQLNLRDKGKEVEDEVDDSEFKDAN